MNFSPLTKFLFPIISKLTVLILLIVFIYVLCNILRKKHRKEYQFRINNFYISFISAFLYLFFFPTWILYIRISNLGFEFDLKPLGVFYYKLKLSFLHNAIITIYYCTIVILCIILILVLLLALHTLFVKEIIKCHLYLMETQTHLNPKMKLKYVYNYYQKNIERFCYKYSYNVMLTKILKFLILSKTYTFINFSILNLEKNDQRFHYFLLKVYHKIEKYMPILVILLIPICIIYDCLYNDWVLSKIFYYLIFYMLFNIWKRISSFLQHTDNSFNLMFYELYYKENNIEYFNFDKEAEDILYKYQSNGLQWFLEKDLFSYYWFHIVPNYKYISHNGILFINQKNECYLKKNNEERRPPTEEELLDYFSSLEKEDPTQQIIKNNEDQS